MSSAAESTLFAPVENTISSNLEDSLWYAVYTRSRHEQVVKSQLDRKGVENFLPHYTRISQWKDRSKQIQTPLFPGYLFVKILLRERLAVLKTFGAVYLVGDGTNPLAVPEDSILSMQRLIEEGFRYDPHPYLSIGNRVRIVEGPLNGIEGILIRKKNKSLLIISVHLIQRSTSVEIESWKIEKV